MHEIAIAEGIIKQAKQQGEVEGIRLEIGELAHVPAHELVECLKKLVDWNIDHEEIHSQVQCSCGFNGHPTVLERGHDSFVIECPKCKSWPEITSGTDITLVSVKVK